jgi:hypothetical protein
MEPTHGIGMYMLTIGMRMLFLPLAILYGGIGVTAQWVWAGVDITEDTVITPDIMEVATEVVATEVVAMEVVIGGTTPTLHITMAEGILPDIGQETYIITIVSLFTLQIEQVTVRCRPLADRRLMKVVAQGE